MPSNKNIAPVELRWSADEVEEQLECSREEAEEVFSLIRKRFEESLVKTGNDLLTDKAEEALSTVRRMKLAGK